MNFTKILFLGAGWLSLGIAGIGIIFPSPEMRERIRSHNTFGPYVSGWQDGRIIPLNAKIAASVVIAAASVYLWVFGPLPKLVAGLIILGMVAAEIYILGRPIK
jgi:uncharacterized membrane protein YbaN (DUF454 family)